MTSFSNEAQHFSSKFHPIGGRYNLSPQVAQPREVAELEGAQNQSKARSTITLSAYDIDFPLRYPGLQAVHDAVSIIYHEDYTCRKAMTTQENHPSLTSICFLMRR